MCVFIGDNFQFQWHGKDKVNQDRFSWSMLARVVLPDEL